LCKLATASRVRFAGNTGEPTSHVMVNLSAVRYIDSSVVASLVEALKASRNLGVRFILFGLSTRPPFEPANSRRIIQYGGETI
jgi:ABC-type transporter Mla MlaB component